METVLRGHSNDFVYIDDIFVASTSETKHLHHLEQVFDRLKEKYIYTSPDKCVLGDDELDFLTHHVSSKAIKPLLS